MVEKKRIATASEAEDKGSQHKPVQLQYEHVYLLSTTIKKTGNVQ